LIFSGLLLAADHQYRRSHHHQRPQHRGFLGRQRPQIVKRVHCGQHRAGFGPGVPQHRGDRHGELAGRAERRVRDLEYPQHAAAIN